MESWMEKILLELNSISRVAVIEQAFDVEKMLRNYTKLLKYRWVYEGTTVIASMEFTHLEMLLEYYQLKWNKGLTFQIQVGNGVTSQIDMKSVMIPHFTFCSTLVDCLEEIQSAGMQAVHINVLATTVGDKLVMTIILQGNINCHQLKEKILQKPISEYDTFFSARKQWIDQYGDDSVSVEVEREMDERDSLIIKYVKMEAVG